MEIVHYVLNSLDVVTYSSECFCIPHVTYHKTGLRGRAFGKAIRKPPEPPTSLPGCVSKLCSAPPLPTQASCLCTLPGSTCGILIAHMAVSPAQAGPAMAAAGTGEWTHVCLSVLVSCSLLLFTLQISKLIVLQKSFRNMKWQKNTPRHVGTEFPTVEIQQHSQLSQVPHWALHNHRKYCFCVPHCLVVWLMLAGALTGWAEHLFIKNHLSTLDSLSGTRMYIAVISKNIQPAAAAEARKDTALSPALWAQLACVPASEPERILWGHFQMGTDLLCFSPFSARWISALFQTLVFIYKHLSCEGEFYKSSSVMHCESV